MHYLVSYSIRVSTLAEAAVKDAGINSQRGVEISLGIYSRNTCERSRLGDPIKESASSCKPNYRKRIVDPAVLFIYCAG
jgi:hypothetical protein